MTKIELIIVILQELRKAQIEPWKPRPQERTKSLSLPPMLPLPDGRQIAATDDLLAAIHDYARICWDNDPAIKLRATFDEYAQFARRAFGQILYDIELESTDEEICQTIRESVDSSITTLIQDQRQSIDLTLGCHVLDGDDAYPIRIGPVRFETRKQWLRRMDEDKKLTSTTRRRLEDHWNGRTLKKRKPSLDSAREDSILRSIDACPTVCTVETDSLSAKFTREKGVLAARLAITAVALMWRPASSGLDWMNLLYDLRLPVRYTVSFGISGTMGSFASSQAPHGRIVNNEILETLNQFQSLFDQIGLVLSSYVQPMRINQRPNISNAIFLSLWWFHEACREPMDQIATTKFAASLDALTGGHRSRGIMQFLETRGGFKPEMTLMVDGRTTKETIKQIYSDGRSQLIHGSSDNFAHDWSDIRQTAEAVAQFCLVQAISWMEHNPNSDDLNAMRKP